jgi:hypothetical protein
VGFQNLTVCIENGSDHRIGIVLKGEGGQVGLRDLAQPILAIVTIGQGQSDIGANACDQETCVTRVGEGQVP